MLETLPLPEADDPLPAPPTNKLDVSSLPPPSVAPCPVMAEAEASLEAPAAAEEEDFRRKQLAVRAEEKEAQQAAREEAKNNKEKQQKPKAKAKGRPRKTDDEAAPKRAPKRKNTEEAEVPANSAPAEAKPKKQRRTAAKSKAKPGPPGQWEYPPDVDRDMIPEFLEVMKQFKDQSYDKSEMTLHTKYLDLFFWGLGGSTITYCVSMICYHTWRIFLHIKCIS